MAIKKSRMLTMEPRLTENQEKLGSITRLKSQFLLVTRPAENAAQKRGDLSRFNPTLAVNLHCCQNFIHLQSTAPLMQINKTFSVFLLLPLPALYFTLDVNRSSLISLINDYSCYSLTAQESVFFLLHIALAKVIKNVANLGISPN